MVALFGTGGIGGGTSCDSSGCRPVSTVRKWRRRRYRKKHPNRNNRTSDTPLRWKLNGKNTFFQFKVLPFGLTSGPLICKKLFRPLIKRWRSKGILCVLFFDDGIMCAQNYSDCKSFSDIIKGDLLNAHVLPNCEKSTWTPQKCLTWLGYFWNFETKTLLVSKVRTERLTIKLLNLLAFCDRPRNCGLCRIHSVYEDCFIGWLFVLYQIFATHC